MKMMMITMEKEAKRKKKINKMKNLNYFLTNLMHREAKSVLINGTSWDS